MQTYEARLNADTQWALQEGSLHFERKSSVHRALMKIVTIFERLQLPYAVAGCMAMFFHGYRRFTEDIHIVITPKDWIRFCEFVVPRDYVLPGEGSKQLRDAVYGVRITFLMAGEHCGHSNTQPIAIPEPSDACVIDGICVLRIESLIELCLASGNKTHRRRDLADVQELIKSLKLHEDIALSLDRSVREMYLELWREAQVVDPVHP